MKRYGSGIESDRNHPHDQQPNSPKRRELMKFMALSGAAALGVSQGLSASTPPQGAKTQSAGALDSVSNVDVVVIGAGYAGTTAARECCKAGLKTVLLEARNRLGGRTFTSKFGNEQVEMGGTWVHWFQPNVWAEAMHYGLEIEETPGFASPEKFMWLSGGKLINPSIEQGSAVFEDVMKKFNEDSAKIFPRPYDPFYKADLVKKYDGMSVMDRVNQLNLPPEQADLLIGMMELCISGSCKIGAYLDMARWWALSGNNLWLLNDAAGRYYFKHGTVSLINAMISDGNVPVFVSAPVTGVKHDNTGTTVNLRGGKVIRARKVIVAVPLNVIKSIEFHPAVSPQRLEGSNERHAGSGIKVHIKVKGVIPSFLAFAHEPEPFSSIWTERTGPSDSMLIAFGSSPKLIDVHDPQAVQTALRKFLPDVEVTDTLAYDWTIDPYALGTWCVYRPNMSTKYLQQLQKPEGRVYFANSDWANGWRGFIDGAIEQGRSTGQEVVRSFRA